MKYLVVIVGPTAVGKTAVAIELARHFHTEVVSADSRQFYKEMCIGTTRPAPEEMGGVAHHFVGSHSIQDDYDVGAYEKEALNCLNQLYKTRDVVILAGGSGLFVDAVCRGFDDLPKGTPELRHRLAEQLSREGIESLQSALKVQDPVYYNQVDLNNPQRLIRALEVIESTGTPFSAYRRGVATPRPFQVIKTGLEMNRETLYRRIDHRVDLMIESGLFEEAASLYQYRQLNALQTVGYKEIYGYMDGEYGREEAIHLLKRNSRRYAKRQLTWFKRDKSVQWFQPGNLAEIIEVFPKGIPSGEC